MIGALLALAAAAPEPPKGVNDSVIGTAEQFRREGPKSICLENTKFELVRGESSFLAYLGIHAGSIRVVGPKGEIKITEGDAWAKPKKTTRVYDTKNGFVERSGRGSRSRYLIHAPSDFAEGLVPRVWVEGSAIRGTHADRQILDRLEVTAESPAKCDQRFGYGWDTLLGEPTN